jgi:hypothetical protein
MVDGELVNPKDLDDKGEYTGKLKKDTYYDSGRIYQKIPDLLKSYIHRHDQKITPIQEETREYEIENRKKIEADTIEDINKSIDEFGFSSNLNESDVIVTDQKITFSEEESGVLEVEELDFDKINIEEVVNPKSELKEEKIDIELKLVEPFNYPIFEFVFKAEFSKYNAKKLKAICILAEGDHALRVKSPSGKILIPESKQTLINVQEYSFLCRLFGLG